MMESPALQSIFLMNHVGGGIIGLKELIWNYERTNAPGYIEEWLRSIRINPAPGRWVSEVMLAITKYQKAHFLFF